MEMSINNYNYQRGRYYFNMQNDMRNTFVNFGKWLERDRLEDNINNYEEYLNNSKMIESKNTISKFVDKLLNGDYKVILYNGQTPILEDDTGIINLIFQDITEESIVELNNDSLIIHNENVTVTLTGHEDMSEGEIYARRYLDSCEGSYLIVKDNPSQVEMREDNCKNTEEFYDRCSNIVCIRTFSEDDEDYKMNWDAIWVYYDGQDKPELWQRP
jgi:hypothetical protein